MPLTLDQLATRKKTPSLDELIQREESEDYNLPIPADPSEPPAGFVPEVRETPAQEQHRPLRFEAPTEPTGWQKFKQFFVGDRPSLPPNADRMEKVDRAFDIAIGTPLRVFLKFSKGKAWNIPDFTWAAIKKITPNAIWPEVKKMNLDQAMDWAAGYDPSGFEKAIGGLAEFWGRLQTAKQIGQATGVLGTKATLPKDMTKLIRAGEATKLWGLAATGREFSKLIAETIDPQTDYQYQGAAGIIRDMGIGAGLSLGVSTIVQPTLAKVAQSAIGKKIISAADRVLINLSKKFPQTMDVVRKNPQKYFVEKTEEYLKYKGIKLKDLAPQEKAVVNHVARESQRRFVQAYKNYVPPPDIVYPTKKPKVPARITGKPAPTVPAKPSELPVAPITPAEPTATPPKVAEGVKPAIQLKDGSVITGVNHGEIVNELQEKGRIDSSKAMMEEGFVDGWVINGQFYDTSKMTSEEVSTFLKEKQQARPAEPAKVAPPKGKVKAEQIKKLQKATYEAELYHEEQRIAEDTPANFVLRHGFATPTWKAVERGGEVIFESSSKIEFDKHIDENWLEGKDYASIYGVDMIILKPNQPYPKNIEPPWEKYSPALEQPKSKGLKAKVAKEAVAEGKVAEKIDTAKFARQARIEEAMTKGEMGEIEVELGPEIGSASPAFNKHIDYFISKQLPETSRIRTIQKMIRVINGKRLAGKITPQQANKRIANLRKRLFQVAQKEGVSVRMTKGGKVLLAVRKAGTYAPEEFSQYGKFKNTYPLGQDVTRSVQKIDGALSVKEKVQMKGQAGPLERYVLWPTREMSKQKLEYLKEKTATLKKIFKTKPGTKEDAQINIVLEKIAGEDRSKSIKDIVKSTKAEPSIVKQAIELRKFYDDLIEEQNQARKMRNQDPIPYRQNYSPHILRDVTIWERMMMKDVKEPRSVFGDKTPLPDYIKPNKPFNPRELAREAGIPYDKRVLSAIELAQSYLVTAAKDVFNTSIIQNNKAFIQQLETMGNKNAANFISDWTAEAYAGIKPALDRGIKLTYLPKTQRGMQYFNRIRNLAVFPLNFSWNLLTQTSSLALTVGRYGTVNTARGFYQWLKPNIRKQAAEDYYSYIVKSAKQGRITRQDAQNLIGESVKLRRTTGDLARDISTYFLEQLEKILTGTSIRAAYLHGAKRGLTGEALKNYASDGGAKTQSMYNDEDKPAFLRSVAVKTGAPYQTFAYEVMNTLREWTGTTGTPPDTKLYTVWTVVRFLAAATIFAAIAKKGANKDVWSWKRPPIPFAEFWLNPIIGMFSKEYMAKSASGLTSPVETTRRIAKGIDDVLETNNWRKLRNELIKYGPGVFGIPGGVQWSRTVDAIIAYSQGGVRDRRGRLLFKMEDPQDLIQAIFSGVWTTKEGREYLEKRSGKKQKRPSRPSRPRREVRR